jgi:hypothetical protein
VHLTFEAGTGNPARKQGDHCTADCARQRVTTKGQPGHLERGFDGSAPVFIGSTISVPVNPASSRQTGQQRVVECPRGQRHPVQLLDRCSHQGRMPMPEVQCRVASQETEVTTARDVGDRGASTEEITRAADGDGAYPTAGRY